MRLIILDRDGVINEDSDAYVKSVDEWVPLAGSIEAIARLSRAGYTMVVATNQSGLGRGYFSAADLEAMHGKLRRLVATAGGEIAGIYFCPHRPDENCDCRKPRPGLLRQIMEDFRLQSLAGTPSVGDSLRDLEAGVALGCRPVLVRTGKGLAAEVKLAGLPELAGTLVFDNLAAYADQLLGTAA